MFQFDSSTNTTKAAQAALEELESALSGGANGTPGISECDIGSRDLRASNDQSLGTLNEYRLLRDEIQKGEEKISFYKKLHKRLEKSDLSPQTFLRRLKRAVSIDDPEFGLLPDKSYSSNEWHPVLEAIAGVWTFVAMPVIASYLSTRVIPAELDPGGMIRFAIIPVSVELLNFACLIFSEEKNPVVKFLAKCHSTSVASSLTIACALIQATSTTLKGAWRALVKDSAVDPDVEKKLVDLINSIRVQNIPHEEREIVRSSILAKLAQDITNFDNALKEPRSKLHDIQSKLGHFVAAKATLKQLRDERITEARTKRVIDQAIKELNGENLIFDDLEFGIFEDVNRVKDLQKSEYLFPDLIYVSGTELKMLYDASTGIDALRKFQELELSPTVKVIVNQLLEFSTWQIKQNQDKQKIAVELLHVETKVHMEAVCGIE